MITVNINSKEELETILSTSLVMYEDCVIELKNDYGSIFIISSRITENNILLSLCAGSKSLGDVIERCNYDKINNFIKEKCIDNIKSYENISAFMTPKIDANGDDLDDLLYQEYNFDSSLEEEYDYRDEYITKHNRIRAFSDPLKIETINQALVLFNKFLMNDNCDKLIISFEIYIPDLSHAFIIDLVADKIFICNRTMVSLMIQRPDSPNLILKYPYDRIDEYSKNNKESVNTQMKNFYQEVMTCFMRCMKMSKQEIKIYAYSNIKLRL